MKLVLMSMLFLLCAGGALAAESNISSEEANISCDGDIFRICPCGEIITTFKCISEEKVATNYNCPNCVDPPDQEEKVVLEGECGTDKVIICWDQSEVTTHFCVGGEYVTTNKECPEKVTAPPVTEGQPGTEGSTDNKKNAWYLTLGIILIGWIILYVRKRKKEEEEAMRRQVEQFNRVQGQQPQGPPQNPFDAGRYQ